MDVNNIPPVPAKHFVLIRGLVRSRYHWLDFPQRLGRHLGADRVDCVELAGNGYRHAESSPASIREAVADLRGQIPASGKYHLIGISLGGMLATAWAQMFPQEAASLLLINSSSHLSPFYRRLSPSTYLNLLRHLAKRNPAEMEKFILGTTVNNREKWIPHLNAFAEFQRTHPVSTRNFIRQLRLASQVNFYQVPPAPKLVLVSEKDRLVSPACSEEIARAWGCKIEHHPTAGHDLPLDDGNWLLSRISDFLKS